MMKPVRPAIDVAHFAFRLSQKTGENEMSEVAFNVPKGNLDDATRGRIQQELGIALDILDARRLKNNAEVVREHEENLALLERRNVALREAAAIDAARAEGANGGADPAGALHPPADS